MPNTSPASAWSTLIEPDPAHVVHDKKPHATKLVACKGWDAIVVSPLRRGLAALDALALPRDGGYPVLADYVRQELVVQVPAGTGHRCDVPGTRVLSTGSWLLVPTERPGSIAATWLSKSHSGLSRLLDADQLRNALLSLDGT